MARMTYAQALAETEEFLAKIGLTQEQRDRGCDATIYDYHDGEINRMRQRPLTGVRVAEVSFAGPSEDGKSYGGGSFMQVEVPHGIAVCGQTERCIIALAEDWDSSSPGEIREEFWRLGWAVLGDEWDDFYEKHAEYNWPGKPYQED